MNGLYLIDKATMVKSDLDLDFSEEISGRLYSTSYRQVYLVIYISLVVKRDIVVLTL